MFFSWDGNDNYTFTIVCQHYTVLLVIKPPESIVSDTVKFVAPVAKKFLERIYAVEGFLLLEGSFKMTYSRLKNKGDKISLDLHGNVNAPNWTEYRVLHSSLSLEEPFRGHISFLLEFKDREGKVHEKIMLYKKKKNFELYDFTRNSMFNYELKEDSKICLMTE